MTVSFGEWWAGQASKGLNRREVVKAVQDDAGWSNHFAFMILMSAGIAVLGLLLSSPAIVIGAMLISPLMGPLIGLGFALATFDARELRRAGTALALGVILAVVFCALIVAVSPLQTVTTEISTRTRPNLFDLLVALFSGLAGTYAMIRGRHGAIVGVAIATAVMPPLAVMGFGLATLNWHVFGGSSLLFFTNMMTITASAAALARLYGFAPGLSPEQTRVQATLITVVLVALAVPLALSLRQIAREAIAGREANATIAAQFPEGSRVNDLTIDYHSRPVEVSATVFTPRYREVPRDLGARLATVIGRPAVVILDQVRTQDGMPDAPATSPTAAQRSASRMAERLALVAGVPIGNVIVDRGSKRAIVRAEPLRGASLDAYRTLERRISAGSAGWNVNLIPPPAPLADVAFDGDKPDQNAIDTAIWASQRLGLPIDVIGGSRVEAEQVVELLEKGGVEAQRLPSQGHPGRVELRWSLEDETDEDG